jgi:hypothetical protein
VRSLAGAPRDCPPSLGLLTLNALTAASQLVVVTEPSFMALQGIDELLETHELVRGHYNGELELAGVIVNRFERTVEHRESVEIERYFGADLVWRPLLTRDTSTRRANVPNALASSRAGRRASSPTGTPRRVASCTAVRFGPSERRPRPHSAAPAESAARSASRVRAGTDGLGMPKLGDE